MRQRWGLGLAGGGRGGHKQKLVRCALTHVDVYAGATFHAMGCCELYSNMVQETLSGPIPIASILHPAGLQYSPQTSYLMHGVTEVRATVPSFTTLIGGGLF